MANSLVECAFLHSPFSNIQFFFFPEQLNQLLILMGKLYTIIYYGYRYFYYCR